MQNPHAKGPGQADLEKIKGKQSGTPGTQPTTSQKPPVLKTAKGTGTGGGGGSKKPAPKKDESEPAPEPLDMSGSEDAKKEEKVPQAVLRKIGWVDKDTRFNTNAPVFAEFEIPKSVKDRTLVDFQLWEDKDGEYVIAAKDQGHVDETGKATTTFPIRKGENLETTYALKAKHCSQEDFPDDPSADRVVTESAAISCEHTQVSGIHFPKGKSFIGDVYLETLCALKKTYLEWKKTHDKAQIIVYGHSEADKDGEAHALSKSRALAAYSFIIGDVDRWADLAEKERWGVWEQQCMLRALGYLDAKPNGTRGPKTRKATEKFIAFMEKERGKKFNPMLGLGEAYIRKELYREYLNFKRADIELPSSAFRLVSGFPYVACSGFNRYLGGEELHDENRRVVFVIVHESPNFPVTFPCRSGSTGPCEDECKKPGERAIKGFRCKFYDSLVETEKVGEGAKSGDGHEIETKWKGYPGQNDFNDEIFAAAEKYSLDPLVFKSLIAQESAFKPKAKNDVGFAGLTQVGGQAIEEAGLKIGTTAKVGGKYVYDMDGDERFDPKKSIEAGAQILKKKMERIDKAIFSKFKTQPSQEEKLLFYLASYNAGEGTIRNAWKKNGETDCTFADLCEGAEKSALYKVIPESWGPAKKYKEISEYPVDILERIKD